METWHYNEVLKIKRNCACQGKAEAVVIWVSIVEEALWMITLIKKGYFI
jgi:hypothetical protein